ncbi:MAG: hypothetical protein ABSG02_03010 [Terriglobales bacterium]
MDQSQQSQIEIYLTHLDALIRRGLVLRDRLVSEPPNGSNGSAMAETRAWQEDCGVTINQLSGGSKAHWLARAFSGAFLMRSPAGQAVEGAPPAEIVQRLVDVLQQAVSTLSAMDGGPASANFPASKNAPASGDAPPPHRFDFVHNPELRPVLEQAYIDSRLAFDQAAYDEAFRTTCGILEAIVTDALEFKGLPALAASGIPAGEEAGGKISDWSFNTRLAVAERARLIRGGCVRLPAIARTYRDQDPAAAPTPKASEREARVTAQVLHVIMRDLDPGR